MYNVYYTYIKQSTHKNKKKIPTNFRVEYVYIYMYICIYIGGLMVYIYIYIYIYIGGLIGKVGLAAFWPILVIFFSQPVMATNIIKKNYIFEIF